MSDEHADGFVFEGDDCVDDAARLAAGKADVMELERMNLRACKQRVAKLGIDAFDGRTRDGASPVAADI